MTGQNTNDPVGKRWQGNDLTSSNVGGTDYLARVTGYTIPGTGNRSLVQGGLNAQLGYVPGTTNVRLWRPFSPVVSNSSTTVSFFVEWSLIPSIKVDPLTYTNNDLFSFDLRSSGNAASLAKFSLTPGINLQSNSYTFQWIRNAGTEAAITNTLYDLGYQAVFQLRVDMTGSTFDAQISQIIPSNRVVVTNFGIITNGAVSDNLSAQDFGATEIDWNLSSGNPNKPGANYIVVNDMSVSVVPEPSTVSLLALGGVAAVLALARRRNS